MSVVRLGKLMLNWCHNCNLPILSNKCSICNSETKEVNLTPPGDIRPAFDYDKELICKTIDNQFSCDSKEIFKGKIVILNKIPSLDKMEEVIIDGKVVGALKYDLDKGYVFLPRLCLVRRLEIKKGYVSVDIGAMKTILKNANVLCPGILNADEKIKIGEEVVVFFENKPIAVGTARADGEKMRKGEKGVAVKVRWADDENEEILKNGQSLEMVIKANENVMKKEIEKAKNFIKNVSNGEEEIAVSYSGGKDSLVTLLLVLETGIRPKIIFIDTGLEFEETKKNVEEIAKQYNLQLISESAEDGFWKNIEFFGVPSKDYRWCCKICKLGITTLLINKNFKKVLTFIGQRRYESQSREKKGNVWKNPWVPNQYSASPIQNWTALHVWLYIFMKNANYNELYERGFERIGCFLCPSSDLAELQLVKENFKNYEKWENFLKNYAKEKGYSDDWLKYGLWRWKRTPKVIQNFAKDKNINLNAKEEKKELKFYSAEGFSICEEGISIEGTFNSKLNVERIFNLLKIIGKPELDKELKIAFIGKKVEVFEDGIVIVRAGTKEEVEELLKKVKNIVIRAMLCVNCGICLGKCDKNAIELREKIFINENCVHCQRCLEKCPVNEYGFNYREEY